MEITLQRFHEAVAVQIDGTQIPYVSNYKIESSCCGATELSLKIVIPKDVIGQEVNLSTMTTRRR